MKIFSKTDTGRVRTDNQDAFFAGRIADSAVFAVVCDGMGGANAGNIASEIAVRRISEYIIKSYRKRMDSDDLEKIVRNAISSANIELYDMSVGDAALSGMGTTVVVALVKNDKAVIAHVGDSRVYLWKEEELYQVTKDHSIVQTLIDRGELMPEDAAHHPQKNMITRAVGVSRFVDIDFIEITNLEASGLLLCSDGLTNVCSDEEIKEVLLHTPPEEVCEVLTNKANEGGGFDNITIVYMKKD